MQGDLERFDALDCRKTEYSINGGVNTSWALPIRANYSGGGQIFFDPDNPFLGDGRDARLNVTVRPLARLSSDLSVNTG